MQYMLLIHQGSTPVPPSPEWDSLPEAEKGAVYGAYKTRGFTVRPKLIDFGGS